MTARTEYKGGWAQATTTALMLSGATSFSVTAGQGTGAPTGSVGDFVVAINRGASDEEHIRCSSRTTDAFTVATSGRGYAGTSAQQHAAGATVDLIFDAVGQDLHDDHVNTTTRDDHTQYYNATRHDAHTHVGITGVIALSGTGSATTGSKTNHTHVFRSIHTWLVSGSVVVPSGAVAYLPPSIASVSTGETLQIVEARYVIRSGTSVTVSVQKNGSTITGGGSISVTTTKASTTPTATALVAGDDFAPVVTAVSGSPDGMSFTIVVEHTITGS